MYSTCGLLKFSYTNASARPPDGPRPLTRALPLDPAGDFRPPLPFPYTLLQCYVQTIWRQIDALLDYCSLHLEFIAISPAVKAPILGEACIRVRIKYFYSFMTFGPY